MEDHLISKKDLLELTGISYGQLYRWKRKDLIPEDWFIRKSTFTGQETFFPKDKILERIDKIVNLKDNTSLDDLADLFSPSLTETALYKKDIIERNIVSEISLKLLTDQIGDWDVLTYERLIAVYVLDQLLLTGEMSLDEGKILLQVLNDHYKKFDGKSCDLLFIRKMGIATFLLISGASEVYLENNAKLVKRLVISSSIEALKTHLS
ncbi:hypothetical protein BVG16_10200 [Paenibacillus selenitireducens]|jgi:hypothetical protein|uniref:DUF4004 domain-containing protein n=1 Tax=Paenibacillus selenitireducens TaxID=1324314 RepID=A0A1T2XHS6_9BACL|nr:YhbD family protein [Paenibacillus selenitireducens]OPA79434.1 hypothetical protein BVG16_10200 [Paenibacillus selenitireducens]